MDFEARRAAFGARLRELRERQGLTGRDAARALDWRQSKVSKLETGKQTADDSDVLAWCDLVGASESVDELLAELADLRIHQIAWRRQLRAGHRDKQARQAARHRDAHRIRAVDITSVTGLVQTPGYARQIFATQAELFDVPRDLDAAVQARVERQQILYDTSKQIEILIAEAALRHPIAPPAEMAAQIDRLQSLLGLPHIRFGLLPQQRQLPHVPAHGYWIVDDHVEIENISSEGQVDDPDQVAIYHRLTDALWTVAVDGDDARALLLRLARDYAEAH